MKRQSGFTVIEALVTVTVIAVLVSAAVPSFTTTIKNGRLATQGNDLLGALLYARSQAIARNTNIMVCSSSDQATCSGSTSWENGWIVGVDNATNDGIVAGSALRVHDLLTGNNTLRNDASTQYIVFGKGSGIPSVPLNTNVYFKLCDTRGTSYARAIYLNSVGEARISPTPGKKLDGTTTMPSCP